MDESIENNEVKPQAPRYLHHVYNSSPLKHRLASEIESGARDRSSRSPNNSKDVVSTKDPVNAGDGEAKPAAKRQRLAENKRRARDRSRSPVNYKKDVSTKDPVNSGDDEAKPAAKW